MEMTMEQALKTLSLKKKEWLNIDLEKRISYLQSAKDNLIREAKDWAEICSKAKGLSTQDSGQEWLVGPVVVMRTLSLYIKALKEHGRPTPSRLSQRNNGQYVARILPQNTKEAILWKGVMAEVWIQKDKAPSQGHFYQDTALKNPTLCLILGAGNVSSIAPLDAMQKLFLEGKVCLVKLNPVNDYLLNVLDKVFENLIADGYLAFVRGDGKAGAYLCEHAAVDEIHITGSHVTHDHVVWGNNEKEIAERKKENNPILKKEITSELGCVTPTIIVPGTWTEQNLLFQARNIVSGVENNASFNCNAIKILVTHKNWRQRESFLDEIRKQLKILPPRKAYYPGAQKRYQEFLNHYSQYEILGKIKEDCIAWTFIPNVKEGGDPYAFQNEAFCGVLLEVPLEADNTIDFLKKAEEFCNNKLWGTLSCSIFIDPVTESKNKKEFNSFLENLSYGSIGINCWAALSYALGSTTWGAYPGHTLKDIQSGIGTVHNAFMFDFPEKSVVRTPFHMSPTPVWFYDNKNTLETSKALLKYEYTPNLWNFFKLVYAGLKG